MSPRILALAFALAAFPLTAWLAACGDDDAGGPSSDAGLSGDSADGGALAFVGSPVTGLPDGVRFASAVPYGPDPLDVIDAFLPTSDKPTAAVIYIHGGGFVSGSRVDVYTDAGAGAAKVHDALQGGVAWLGIDYRMLEPVGTEHEGVKKSLHDCRRALQFVRHNATTFNIDPARIGVIGVSAGAGTGLWLAFHPDMADPNSTDPIERESTRISAVSAIWPQATYDLLRWAPDVFGHEYSFATTDLFLNVAALRTQIVQFYGLDAALQGDQKALLAALNTPEITAYRADVDMLALMSSDDAPAYLTVDKPDVSPVDQDFDVLHHPLHAKTLYEHGSDAGVPVSADVPAYEISSNSASADESVDFLLKHLTP